MNNTFDFNSKKYIILLILICLVFVIFIVKAFDYLPDNQVIDSNDTEITNINKPSVVNVTTNDESDYDDTEKSKPIKKSGVLYRSKDSLHDENQTSFVEIDAPNGASEDIILNDSINETNDNISPDARALQSIVKARKSALNGNYSTAIDEYNKALDNTQDDEIKAEAYEGISFIYAKNHKYSMALSFASKAYNASPSSSRELLIAKIYYSAGKTDTAIARINQMLKQGFNY